MDDLLQHIGHQHPLLYVPGHSFGFVEYCRCCESQVNHCPRYRCSESCLFSLDERCAELEIAPQINHPFHPKHPLIFLSDSPGFHDCYFCGKSGPFMAFVYHCASCSFFLHVKCALIQPSSTENFSSCLHDHPLILIENHKNELHNMFRCKACEEPLSGPIYKCLDCRFFYFHKECGEVPSLQIYHPYDRAHPLSLWTPKAHPNKCCCRLCEIGWKGLGYCCSICNIGLTLEEVNAPRTITDAASHRHPWTLIKYPISFTCQFCGVEEGDRTPYICTACDLIIHKKCISLPKKIRIARHPHPISHAYAYSLQQNQQPEELELECRICFEEVNVRYGIYRCSVVHCNYISHVNCATDKDVWDGTVVLEDDQTSEQEVDSRSMITNVIREERVGEEVVATEIKHAFHHHNLILTFRGETNINICDGCMRPISTPFYNCEQQCKFSLHKSCAELPRQKGHAIHKHLLKLTKNDVDDLTWCNACRGSHHGFSYKCDQRGCLGCEIDVQCSLLPDTLRHPCHEHPLFLSHNNRGVCSGCCSFPLAAGPAYRCTKRCDFALDIRCLTLPLTAGYKYDKHRLTLTYYDNSDPTQLYCDFCEEERDSKPWFYYCARCDNSVHQQCVLGEFPFIKPGRHYKNEYVFEHDHPLTFVDNIWDCPPCMECGKLCHRQALECKQSGCNFTVHFGCSHEYGD